MGDDWFFATPTLLKIDFDRVELGVGTALSETLHCESLTFAPSSSGRHDLSASDLTCFYLNALKFYLFIRNGLFRSRPGNSPRIIPEQNRTIQPNFTNAPFIGPFYSRKGSPGFARRICPFFFLFYLIFSSEGNKSVW